MTVPGERGNDLLFLLLEAKNFPGRTYIEFLVFYDL